jgi:hypothetical protein
MRRCDLGSDALLRKFEEAIGIFFSPDGTHLLGIGTENEEYRTLPRKRAYA